MSKHAVYKAKQVPKGRSSDLARAIENYKRKEKKSGRTYSRSEDRQITSDMTRTLINKAKGQHKVHPSQK